MSTTPTFDPRLIGQTEKTLNVLLARELAGTGVTEPQWIALTLTASAGGGIARDPLAAHIADALHIEQADAQGLLNALAAHGLLEVGNAVDLTDTGRELHTRMKHATAEITNRLWGDLPREDMEAAGRVLTTVLERANSELAGP